MSQSILIVEDGRACFEITYSPDASACVSYAGDQLGRFIFKKTGCTLPVHPCETEVRQHHIHLAVDANLAAVHKEAYRIGGEEQGITIVGATAPAVVHGVMDFLETEVGIGFAGLGDEGVRVDPSPTLEIAIKPREVAPDFSIRGMNMARAEDSASWHGLPSRLHIWRMDWMAQHRMNLVVLDPPTHSLTDQKTGALKGSWRNVAALAPEARRRGLKVQWGHHAWNRWVPPSKYYDKHPEYYALRNHQRVVENSQLSLCTSNPDVAHVMAEEMIATYKAQGHIDYLSVWPEDGSGMCECADCQDLTDLPQGRQRDKVAGTDDDIFISMRDEKKTYVYARFINEVARLVAREAPQAKLSALFYSDIDAPPIGIKLEPNIVPIVALYWRCSRHRLNDPDCENVYYQKIIEQWTEQYPDRVVIYDYAMGMAAYADLPWPIWSKWHEDWRQFKRMGVRGATLQSAASHFTVYGPSYAFWARMAWDADADRALLFNPYLNNLYGKAAPPIAKMFRELEQRFQTTDPPLEQRQVMDELLFCGSPTFRKHFSDCRYPLRDTFSRFMDQAGLETIDRRLQQAQALADDPRTEDNVRKLVVAARYWRLVHRLLTTIAQARRQWQDKAEDSALVDTLDQSIQQCQRIFEFLDEVGDCDVLGWCQSAGWTWPSLLRQLHDWRDRPRELPWMHYNDPVLEAPVKSV